MKIRIGDFFSDFFIQGWNLDIDKKLEVEYIDSRQFLKPERIDLTCKLFYIECREKHQNEALAKELYKAHIRAFSLGSFTEPGNEEKNTIDKYFSAFDALIEDAKVNGLNAQKSVVPVGDNGSILDGSHRTAIAIYYNLQLPVVRIEGTSKIYDYEFFKDRGLEDRYLDFMAYLYVLYDDHSYIACLWPRANVRGKIERAEQLIKEACGVVYRKKIKFNYHGLRQLMIHIYGNQTWAGTVADGFKGIPVKARECYRNVAFTTIYVLSESKLKDIVDLKLRIRDIFQMENHSIHITDTKEEAIEAARTLLFSQSIDLLNYGDITHDKILAMKIIKHHDQGNIDGQQLSISATKVLYGLYNYKQEAECWTSDAEIIGNLHINCGYVFGERFIPFKQDELSIREKILFSVNRLKYGVVADMVTNLQIQRKVRHLGGIVLRRLKIIK